MTPKEYSRGRNTKMVGTKTHCYTRCRPPPAAAVQGAPPPRPPHAPANSHLVPACLLPLLDRPALMYRSRLGSPLQLGLQAALQRHLDTHTRKQCCCSVANPPRPPGFPLLAL